MPNYIPDALKRFKRENPNKWQGSTHQHTVTNYCAKQQYEKSESNEPVLGKENKIFIQQVLGNFLYYTRAVDPTMLVALIAIASEQASTTKSTMEKVDQILDYAASQEYDVLTYKASDMALADHSNASYHSKYKVRSRAGGKFFMPKDVSFPPTMELCSTYHRSWKQSCPRPRKQKLEQCTSMQAKLSQLEKTSMYWATTNPKP